MLQIQNTNTRTNTSDNIGNVHTLYWKWRAVVNISYNLEHLRYWTVLNCTILYYSTCIGEYHLQFRASDTGEHQSISLTGESARTYHLRTVAMLFADNCTCITNTKYNTNTFISWTHFTGQSAKTYYLFIKERSKKLKEKCKTQPYTVSYR